MSSFRRTFKPTKEEQLEDSLFHYHLLMLSKENHSCSTCKNRTYSEFYCVGGVRDFEIICRHEYQEGVCNSYEYDDSTMKEVISRIKQLSVEIQRGK